MIAANLARAALLQTSNKELTRDLRVDSSMLDTIHEEFMKLLSDSAIKIPSFQEA